MDDKACLSKAKCADLRRRGIKAVIPAKKDQAANRAKLGCKGGRPSAFDCERYKERNAVERCVNKLRQNNGLAETAGRDSAVDTIPALGRRRHACHSM